MRIVPVLLILGLFASSCGTTSTACSSSNCSGCCDNQGACVTAVNAERCGANGAACQACRLGDACLLGVCAGATAGGAGGGGGSTGGGTGGGTSTDGGSSDGGTTADAGPAFLQVTPAALDFSSCPGTTVTRDFQLLSRAPVPLTLDFTVSDGGVFGLGTTPSMLAPDASVTVQVTFRPLVVGDVRGSVVASGRNGTAAPVTVPLLGNGLNLPQLPILATAPQRMDRSGFMSCTDSSPLSDCELSFPDTPVGQTTSLLLGLENRGCLPLNITSMTAQFIAPPAVGVTIVPSTLTLQAGQREVVVVSVTPMASGLAVGDLVILSNDPVSGNGASLPARILLRLNQ